MGLKTLISNLEAGKPIDDVGYPNHDTPSQYAGANYGNSVSIFDTQNFKQRSLGYGPQGTDIDSGTFFRVSEPEPFIKQNLPGLDETRGGGFLGALDTVSNVGVRGGLVTAGKRAVIDAERLGKYMLSANGLGFIVKNVGLQATNPKLQEGGMKFNLPDWMGGNELSFSNNRTYNLGINTVLAAAANFTGLHINRGGLLPVGKANYRVEQGYRVDSNNDTKYEWNVRGSEIYQEGGTGNVTDKTDIYKANRLASLYNKLVNPAWTNDAYNVEPELYEFQGGPHSVYGLGKTRLKRYTFSNRDAIDKIDMIRKDSTSYLRSKNIGKIHGPKPEDSYYIEDFRKNKNEGGGEIKTGYTNYSQKVNGRRITQIYGYPGGVLAQKFGAQGPGGFAAGLSFPNNPTNPDGTINLRFKSGIPGQEKFLQDQIQSANIIRHEGSFDSTDVAKNSKDYIKFRIEAVDADKPTQSDTMVFRAFLDSMDDSYDSKWNEFNYNGRSEPFYTYGGFNRSISFSFKVAAFSREEMKPLYRKLNYLVSQTAGDYSKTRLRGNFNRLTIGDYFSRVPGFFTSIKLGWKTDYPWEIALNTGGIGNNQDDDMNELPHILDVQCSYQPVHDFIPKKSVTDSPFILPTSYSKTNITDDQTWLKDKAFNQVEATEQAEEEQKKREEEEATIAKKIAQFEEQASACKEEGGVWTWVDEAYKDLGGSCKTSEEITREIQKAYPDDDDMPEIEEEDDIDPWDLPSTDPNYIPNPLTGG